MPLKVTKYDRITCYPCFKLFLIILANTLQNSLTGVISLFNIRGTGLFVLHDLIYYTYATTNVQCIYYNIYQT